MTKVNELEAQRIREEQEKVRTIAKENGAIQVIENPIGAAGVEHGHER